MKQQFYPYICSPQKHSYLPKAIAVLIIITHNHPKLKSIYRFINTKIYNHTTACQIAMKIIHDLFATICMNHIQSY